MQFLDNLGKCFPAFGLGPWYSPFARTSFATVGVSRFIRGIRVTCVDHGWDAIAIIWPIRRAHIVATKLLLLRHAWAERGCIGPDTLLLVLLRRERASICDVGPGSPLLSRIDWTAPCNAHSRLNRNSEIQSICLPGQIDNVHEYWRDTWVSPRWHPGRVGAWLPFEDDMHERGQFCLFVDIELDRLHDPLVAGQDFHIVQILSQSTDLIFLSVGHRRLGKCLGNSNSMTFRVNYFLLELCSGERVLPSPNNGPSGLSLQQGEVLLAESVLYIGDERINAGLGVGFGWGIGERGAAIEPWIGHVADSAER